MQLPSEFASGSLRRTPWTLCGVGALLSLAGCGGKPEVAAMPTPEVAVIKAAVTAVPVVREYAAQTEAVDAVEIRARVNGILERQGYRDGSDVRRGSLLFVIDPQPFAAALSQARATLAQAQAAYVNSKQNLERLQALLADDAVSRQDVDLAIARERSDAANIQAAQALVKTAQLNLGYTTITAPRGGVVSKALVKPGGLVNAATTLLTTLYSVDPIFVSFAVGEQQLQALQQRLPGDPAAWGKAALPFKLQRVDGTPYPFSGTLNFVDAAVDPRAGTVQVRLSVPNPERRLRPGEFLRVVDDEERRDAVLVPQRAVQELQGKHSVFVVGADGKAAARDIVANRRFGNDWAVESGLAAGELVVVDGIQKIKPGAPVKPVMAEPAPAAASPAAPPAATKPEAAKAG